MTVSAQQAADYIGLTVGEPLLAALLAQADVMVDEFLGLNTRCPDEVRDGAVLQLVSELWSRRNSPGGGLQWGPDGTFARLSANAMTSVLPMLRRYKPLGAVG